MRSRDRHRDHSERALVVFAAVLAGVAIALILVAVFTGHFDQSSSRV